MVKKKTMAAFAAVLATGLVLTGCAPAAETASEGVLAGLTGTVGSKEFTEQLILGNIAYLALKDAGADVNYQELAGTANVRAAMMGDEFIGYYEYTGTGWLVHLGNDTPIQGTQAQYEATRDGDLETNGIAWLDGGEFNNTYAFAIARETAEELGIEKMSDVAGIDPMYQTFCVEQEFSARPDGWTGFADTYGLPMDNTVTLDTGAIYQVIADGNDCTFGEVFTTDGRIPALDLMVVTDDKDFFPVYQASFTLKDSLLQEYPAIADVLNPISKAITESEMQRMNSLVDIDGEDPEDVARKFLVDNGFID